MPHPQLKLHTSKKKAERAEFQGLPPEAMATLPPVALLRLEPATIEELRRQGQALFAAGKWQAAADVFVAIDTLGIREPWDALLLSRCYDELGRPDDAAVAAQAAESMLEDWEATLRAFRGEAAR
jgi:hypothetical protein